MPEEPPPFARSLALVIGISEYAGGVPRLRTPRADALELRRLLQRDHGFHVESLIQRATAPRIRAALARLKERTGPDDRVLLYFAGHGHAHDGDDRPRGFLIPEDARARVLDTYLPMDEVYATLDALPCRHVLAILDCCFAGAFRWAGTRDLEAPPRVLYHERYRRFRAIVAAVVVVLALAVLVVLALQQRTEAALTQSEAARNESQIARNESQARALAVQALVEPADEDPRHMLSSALMGIESLRRLPTPNGDRAVRRALQLLLPLDPRLGGGWLDAAVTADGAWAAMIDRDHRVWIVRVADGTKHPLAIPGRARALAFSPDRRWLAIADARTIRLYTGYDGRQPTQDGRPIEAAAEIRRVAFSGRGRWLIVGTGAAADRGSSLWELSRREQLVYMQPQPEEGTLRDIIVSPDERWLVTILDPVVAPTGEEAIREHAIRGGGAAALWDTAREQRHALTRCAGDEVVEIVPPVAFSEDATWLVAMTSGTPAGLLSGSGTATFTAWQLHDPGPSPSPAGAWRERLQDDGGRMIGLPIRATFVRARSTGGIELAGGNHYGQLAVWSPPHEATGCDVHHRPSFQPEPTSAATIGRSVTAIAADPATSRLAVGFEQGYVRIWDLENKREESRVIAQDLPIEELAFVAGKLVTRTAKGVSFWAAPNDDVTSRYRAHHAGGVVFLGDDRRLAVGTGDRETTIFDRETGHQLGAPIPAGGEVLRWNAARQELVIAGERALRRCRLAPIPECEDPLHGSKLAVDGTGSIAAAVVTEDEARTVALIDLLQPTLAPRHVVLRDPRRHDEISRLAIAVGHLAVVYDDGQGGLFALDGTFLDAIPGSLFASPLTMALSNDGSRLAIGKLLGTLDLYAIEGGKLRHYASAPTSRQISEITFHAEGSLIATVHPDGNNNHVHVWSVASGSELVATSAGRSTGDRHLAFSGTSRWLAILEEPESIDVPPPPATVSIVPLQAPDLIELACRRLPPWAAIDLRDWGLVSSDPPPRPCSPAR